LGYYLGVRYWMITTVEEAPARTYICDACRSLRPSLAGHRLRRGRCPGRRQPLALVTATPGGCCRQWRSQVSARDNGIPDQCAVVDGGAGIGSEAICGSAGWVHKKTVAPGAALALVASLHLSQKAVSRKAGCTQLSALPARR
jgi:hypothetical protein